MAEVKTYVDDNRQPVEDREQRKFIADQDGDVAVNVVAKHVEDQLDAILDALDVSVGESHFASASVPTTPGTLQTIISEVVPAGKLRGLTRVVVRCRQEGVANIYADSIFIGSMSTGAASPNATFEFTPKYLVAAGLTIEVQFRQRTGSPIVTVDGHLQAVDKNI
jgi:hypothetical protein